MSSRENSQRTPDEQRALGALRGLDRPRASAEARERARAAFMAVPAEAAPRRSAAVWWVPLTAAAMIALAAFGIWQVGRGPTALWRVTDVVVAEGVRGAPGEGFVMTAGTITTGPESELELQLGDQFRFRMLPGTTIELPPAPRRWRPGELRIAVTSGEIYGTTGELDVPLRVRAAYSEARITGTTFAVFQTDTSSCTCLWEGSLTVTNLHDGVSVALTPQHRFYVYDDGTVSGAQPLDGMEIMKLQMMKDGGILPDPTDER